MKILIIYRHFWPDSPPYASMLRTLGRHLAREGHQVTVWTEQPCYKRSDLGQTCPKWERLDGIAVERLPRFHWVERSSAALVADKIAFPLRILAKALRRRLAGERYDLVWTATIPPIVQGFVGRLVADLFGARFLYHCQDLYPELAGHMGLWPQNGPIYRIAAAIEKRTRRRADLLVTLSGDMAKTVRALAEPRKLAVINNFLLDDFSTQSGGAAFSAGREASFAKEWNDGTTQIIFAGNLGQFQGLEAVVDAMRLVERDHPNLKLVLMGEGKALPALRERAEGLTNVHFEAHLPFEEAQHRIAAADIGLVSLEPGIVRYAFPSKTLTYLGLGLPVLVIADAESELIGMIEANGIGHVASDRSPEAIAACLRTLVENGNEPDRFRGEVARWYGENFEREHLIARWAETIDLMTALADLGRLVKAPAK